MRVKDPTFDNLASAIVYANEHRQEALNASVAELGEAQVREELDKEMT